MDAHSETGALFVEQLDWMVDQSDKGDVSGKLYCPGCHVKLGSFNWAGGALVLQCSILNVCTGVSDDVVWHVPGFQLHMNKLDIRPDIEDVEVMLHHPKLVSNQPTCHSKQKGECLSGYN